MHVTLVTVTYSDRWDLLCQVLDAAKSAGVDACIVVDNASNAPIEALVSERFRGWATVVTLSENSGSAQGYKIGIETASSRGASYILLLDDDNVLTDGCLDILKKAYQVVDPFEVHSSAVVGRRGNSCPNQARRMLFGFDGTLEGSFAGFNIIDIPKKVRWFLGARDRILRFQLPAISRLPWSPYGGMLFHKSLVHKIGLPNPNYVLYQDDIDYSYRITLNKGCIYLVLHAEILDIDRSWNKDSQLVDSATNWLSGVSDFRPYYTFRNLVYWDRYVRSEQSVLFLCNAVLYMTYLFVVSLRQKRLKRFFLLLRAAKEGYTGKLGPSMDFPLPAGRKMNTAGLRASKVASKQRGGVHPTLLGH